MSLVTLGINHNTAPLAVREQLSFGDPELPSVLRELAGLEGVDEVALVSTCNRTEIYAHLQGDDTTVLEHWLPEDRVDDSKHLREALYRYRGGEAVQHLMRVACGLDSMVLGEPQILGQLKHAYQRAIEAGTVGRVLHSLFQGSFSVAKQVRTDTGIGENPVSVAYAAVDLSRQIFADFEQHTALLIGAGETMELAAQHLSRRGLGRLIVANRSHDRAHELAAAHGGYGIGLDELSEHLPEADIVISSTASREPIVSRDAVATAMRRRRHRPMLIVDIAVPRDIQAEASELPDVFLYSMDDLQRSIRENLAIRGREAVRADEIIEARARRLSRELRGLDAVPAIRDLRQNAHEERARVLERAKRMLGNGHSPEAVLEFLARSLTNRLLHRPTVRIREAGLRGESEFLSAARELFELPDETDQEERRETDGES